MAPEPYCVRLCKGPRGLLSSQLVVELKRKRKQMGDGVLAGPHSGEKSPKICSVCWFLWGKSSFNDNFKLPIVQQMACKFLKI